MNTAEKLKLCDKTLGFTLILMLASGIQLEITSGQYAWSVWVHIALGILLICLSVYHIYLHYRKTNWFARFAKNKNIVTRILWWVFLLTAITGIAATIRWFIIPVHSPIGAIHGKIGFLMVLFGVIHAVRHKHNRIHAKRKRAVQ